MSDCCRFMATGRKFRTASLRISLALLAVLALPGSRSANADEPDRPTLASIEKSQTPATNKAPSPGDRNATHPFSFIPVTDMPIEDVDAIEYDSTNPTYGVQVVWPTEGNVHFYSTAGGFPVTINIIPTVSPGVTGCDFVPDATGTYGIYQTLGFFYIYDLTTLPPTLSGSGPLPGPIPQRRDIDPLIFADPVSPTGESAVFVTGNALHCRTIPFGGFRWDITLPSPMVEAVDPVMSPNGNLWAPCVTSLLKIDPIAGTVLGTVLNPGPPVREVDIRFSGAPMGPGPAAAWFPTNLFLSVYDDLPGTAPTLLVPAFGMPGAYIEGNDLEWNPSLAIGYIPTLPSMVQVDPVGLALPAFYSVSGFAHQRNQDAVFTVAGAVTPKWVYAMQGTMVIGDDVLAAPAPVFLPSPGVTYDGVDPAFSDTPPFGTVVSIATSAGTNVYHAPSNTFLGLIPRTPGTGPLRTDVDHKPAPMFGNYIVQPTIGGLLAVGGFGPNDWLVTLANGVEVVNLAAMGVVEFMSYASLGAPGSLTYRGGDAQPTFFGPGPVEPAFSVDNPDQDFVTKCFEYKYALNRWPYWLSRTMPQFYPHYLPFGLFGPPPPQWSWDYLNNVAVILLANNTVAIVNSHGAVLHQIPLPGPPIGGLIWDWDNKICKIRCAGQLEFVMNLTPLGYGQPPSLNILTFGNYTRWYPIVDRMNGWQFVVQRGGRQVWVYDNLNLSLVTSFTLPARCIRRPVFDEQRKTLCMPLANRTVAYFNAHAFRVGQPPHLVHYTSAVLPGCVVAEPVFDLYNHHTVVQLHGNQIAILNNSTAATVWLSGPLPYLPLCPIQIDCYNKIAKCFYRDPAFNYFEMWLDLYPLNFGAAPNLQWISLGTAAPYGYPQFDSVDGFELYRLGTNTIHARSIRNNALVFSVNTPFAMQGNLFIDRVNKYLLCALQGQRLFYIDLHRFTQNLPGATQVINLPLPAGWQAADDIVFVTQLRKAVVRSNLGAGTALAAIDLRTRIATVYPGFSGLPRVEKQLYVNPFRGIVNHKFWDNAGSGGEVIIDMTPTTWQPPLPPQIQVPEFPPPVESCDTIPPPPPPGVPTLPPPQPGDDSSVQHVEVAGLEPGSMLLAYMPTVPGFAPTEATVDEDGFTDDISVVAPAGPQQLCLIPLDVAGNAGPPVCFPITISTDVPVGTPAGLSFALAGTNPVRDQARFALALPGAGRVKINVYDVGGRLLSTVADREFEAGVHDVAWKVAAERVPSGVYFARVASPFGEATVRVVVLQ